MRAAAIGPALLDRLVRGVVPRPVEGFAPPPRPVESGLFVLDRELVQSGLARVPSRSTLVRPASGDLVVISPPPLSGERAAEELAALGPVADVVIPNPFHYVFAERFLARFPGAQLLAAPGAARRVPALAGAEPLGRKPPRSWAGEIEVARVGPPEGPAEMVFFHVPSSSLILTDLAFHLVGPARLADRIAWRAAGIPADFGPGRTSRWLLLRDRKAVRPGLERVLAWPTRRIVVAHGAMLEGAQACAAALRRAFGPFLGRGAGAAG